jgi:hypothetical protein
MDMVPTALQVPWRQSTTLTPANGTNPVLVVTAGSTNTQSAPTKVFCITVVNSDSIFHNVQLLTYDNAGHFCLLGTVTVPIAAGYAENIPPVSLLSIPTLPLDETGQPYIFLNPTDQLQVKLSVALNSGREIDINAFGADF